MFSIPELPTSGSEVSVLMKRVNINPSCGLVELWVNIDDGREHIYKQMRENIQIPERKFCGSEGHLGDLCLVCINDTWHRARIISIQNANYNVFLIDQGWHYNTTTEALAWGSCDSFFLPPEIESCILANVLPLENNWPETAEALLKSLPGRRFNGLVQHVLMPERIIFLDITNVSKDLCDCGFGKKIPVEEFKCLALKYLTKGEDSEADHLKVSCQCKKQDQYFYPELSTNTLATVNVTQVTDPLNIFCKLQIFSQAVNILSEQIHQHYEENSDFGEPQPKSRGDLCAAKGLNGRWHRSLVKQSMSNSGLAEVLHVDEGNTEFVPVGDIKPLHEKFLRMPVVTYSCCLTGVKDKSTGWTMDQTNYLRSLLQHQTVLARFDHYNISQGIYYVTLYANNSGSINSYFVEKVGPLPHSRTEQDSNMQNEPSICLQSLGEERCLDEQNKILITAGSPEGIFPATNGMTDDVPTTGIDGVCGKGGSEHPDSLVQKSLSTAVLSEVQNARDGRMLTLGSNVNISIIESLTKLCSALQTKENADPPRLPMQDLLNHHACAHPHPLACNPGDGMCFRTRSIASQRFQCLFSVKNATNPPVITWTDSALRDFWKFVDLGASSDIGLKCVVKTETFDEEGLLLHVVDIETSSGSPCTLPGQRCEQDDALVPIPPQVSTDAYSYSLYSFAVGGKEKVSITFSESVRHFYCNLEKNSHLLEQVMENLQQLVRLPQTVDPLFGVNSMCLARYIDNKWHRGQVVGMSQTPEVHFVDHGDTLVVNESDICPLPNDNIVRYVPVQAVPLGLFDVTHDVPLEVNQWFADHVVGQSFNISVVAKGENGKLLVQLFDDSLNVNVKIREMILQMEQHEKGELDQQLSDGSKHCLTQELMSVSPILNTTEESCHNNKGACARDELEMNSQSISDLSAMEKNHKKSSDERKKPTLEVILEEKEAGSAETFILTDYSDLEVTQVHIQSCPEENVKTCMYKRPDIFLNKTEEVYSSCVVGPHYFWCQYTNTEELNKLESLAQAAGQAPLEIMSPDSLHPGSPCLALFFEDKLWYRAQVIDKCDNAVRVVFIDYGNECDVDIKNVRPLPEHLLEVTPQAFLCSLDGFSESNGSWYDNVYDVFYNLLVDKTLRVIALNMQDHLETMVPQYTVQVECENIDVNDTMLKYWKPVVKEHVLPESPQTENILQHGQPESNRMHPNDPTENVNPCMYKKPNISKNQKEEVYASCIVEPSFFWCQYANTEEQDIISGLAQEAGKTQLDVMFSKSLGPGHPCLALFSSDNLWYRAQVIETLIDSVRVVFIDYGNESDVELKNVRPLPPSLLEKPPQAFLCRLNGFDESSGSWNEEVNEDLYNLLVDKPLRLTVFDMQDYAVLVVPQYSVELECEEVDVNAAMLKYWKLVAKDPVLTETLAPDEDKTESSVIKLGVSKENTNMLRYMKPKLSKDKKEEVYASCIVEPSFFWCQYTNTEEQDIILRLAQEAGKTQLDMMFSKSLGPGHPCLALFSSDNMWYRAQVIETLNNSVRVVFIDYGNESDVEFKNVRPLPPSLLEKPPQAFLCRLNGFDESSGSWNEEVNEDFYNLLVDKPLRLTVFDMQDHAVLVVPQYKVQIECQDVVTCEWLDMSTLMGKHWKGLDTHHDKAERFGSVYQDHDECLEVFD